MKRVLITLAVDLPVKDDKEALSLTQILVSDMIDPHEYLPWYGPIEVLEIKVLNSGEKI